MGVIETDWSGLERIGADWSGFGGGGTSVGDGTWKFQSDYYWKRNYVPTDFYQGLSINIAH
jgi:hypothetical protein